MRCWNDGRHSGVQRFRVHGVQGSGVQEFTSWRYDLPADYWDTYAAKIEAVTAADIQRVAQKYWAQDRLQIVAVGDLAKVEPTLKKLGTVQVFDADGKPISK